MALSLTKRVHDESKIPTILHLDGNCHTYIHADANADMAKSILVNAKMRRVGICGATESLLIDEAVVVKLLPALVDALVEKKCEVRGCATAHKIDARIKPASDDDWGTEYLAAIISVKVVKDVSEAIAHINRYGSHHTDAIITENKPAARQFLRGVDSAIVMHNTSTQFADGGEFGFGGEIGISTGRLHARGPVGAEQLVTYKICGAWRRTGACISLSLVYSAALLILPMRGMCILAWNALKQLGITKIWWLVSPQNPLKPVRGMSPFAERFAGAKRITAAHRMIHVSDIEQRINTRYTIDTLRKLKKRFPRVQFVWLMGADNLATIHRWQEWAEIFKLVPILVLDRSPFSHSSLRKRAGLRFAKYRTTPRALLSATTPRWAYTHMRRHPESSTRIRSGQ